MSVRAKFLVENIETYPTAGEFQYAHVRMRPVYNDCPENKTWSKYTPSGMIQMTITNEAAVAQFEAGKEYFVDFNPAE